METSIKTTARIAGLLYLVVIAGGLFAELAVRGRLIVHGDATATAVNILAHQQLYRWGFAVELFYCACNVPITLQFYKLFRIVDRDLTLLVVFFSLVGTAVEAVSLLAHIAPLVLLNSGQNQRWAYLALQLFDYGFNIALVFFGFYCVAMGRMIVRSGFLPKIIGWLLAFQGCCYLISSFSKLIAPAFVTTFFPVLMVSGLGEISFCLWLLVMGVDETKWNLKQSTI
jgi:hypothetical protein